MSESLKEQAADEDTKRRLEVMIQFVQLSGLYKDQLPSVLHGALAEALLAIRFDVPTQVPKHRPPDFFDSYGVARYVCECGTVEGLHEFGRHPKCEYFNHHCDSCHERGACTAHDEEIDP